MSEHPRISDEELAKYLDHSLEDRDRVELEARIAADPEAERRLSEMSVIDDSLRRKFEPTDLSTQTIESWLGGSVSLDAAAERPDVKTTGRRRLAVIAALGLAASIAMFVYHARPVSPNAKPLFKPRSLVSIYKESVESGFRPYYFCEDLDRFAATFEKRQGVRLTLADLPADRSMVGLSYVGGLTRDTTTMLCRVDGQPVMVFVDTRSSKSDAEVATEPSSGLFIHQSELGDLVFYEVSPFERAKMMEFLVLAPSQ